MSFSVASFIRANVLRLAVSILMISKTDPTGISLRTTRKFAFVWSLTCVCPKMYCQLPFYTILFVATFIWANILWFAVRFFMIIDILRPEIFLRTTGKVASESFLKLVYLIIHFWFLFFPPLLYDSPCWENSRSCIVCLLMNQSIGRFSKSPKTTRKATSVFPFTSV